MKGPARNWTPEQDDAIRAGYAAGTRVLLIAKQLGRNRFQVIGRANRLGLARSHPGQTKHWTADMKDDLRAAYARGIVLKVVALDLGVTYHATARMARVLGLTHASRA